MDGDVAGSTVGQQRREAAEGSLHSAARRAKMRRGRKSRAASVPSASLRASGMTNRLRRRETEDHSGGAARFFRRCTSLSVRGRNLPGGTSQVRGPSWVRLIFSTRKPICWNMRRIWRLRPSMRTTSYQGLGASSTRRILAGEVLTRRPSSSAMVTPLRRRWRDFSLGLPLILT